MSTHTPGPWEIGEMYDGLYFLVSNQGDDFLNPVVCQLYEDCAPYPDEVTDSESYRAYKNAKANARLLASAPELLEALVEMVEIAEAQGHRVVKARAAIAKATGDSHE